MTANNRFDMRWRNCIFNAPRFQAAFDQPDGRSVLESRHEWQAGSRGRCGGESLTERAKGDREH